LGELTATLTREGLASPSVMVVGDVMSGILALQQPTDLSATNAHTGT
jgi:uroporphyrin-III C-methyltransferase